MTSMNHRLLLSTLSTSICAFLAACGTSDDCIERFRLSCEDIRFNVQNPVVNNLERSVTAATEGDTLAVGQEDRVYIYTKDGQDWKEIDDFQIPFSENSVIGSQVTSLSLDGNILAVGNVGYLNGAVHIFKKDDDTWTHDTDLEIPSAEYGAYGEAVALQKDTLVVGAPQEDDSAKLSRPDSKDNSSVNIGAVYIYTKSDTGWSEVASFKGAQSKASFGSVLSLDGDHLAVGASGEDSSVSQVDSNQSDNAKGSAGAVYIFSRNNQEWSQTAYIKGEGSDEHVNFGGSILLEDDQLLVNAWVDGTQLDQTPQRAIYTFTREDGAWTQVDVDAPVR